MLKRTLLFLLINFAALGIGSIATSAAVASSWYVNLNKAPWTPPGYMFGIVWSFIMICFAIYIAYLIPLTNTKKTISLFAIQWVLNVAWNPIFFHYHQTTLGLVVIILLTLLVGLFLFRYLKTLKLKSVLIAPYLIWLLIATSLNAYIVFLN